MLIYPSRTHMVILIYLAGWFGFFFLVSSITIQIHASNKNLSTVNKEESARKKIETIVSFWLLYKFANSLPYLWGYHRYPKAIRFKLIPIFSVYIIMTNLRSSKLKIKTRWWWWSSSLIIHPCDRFFSSRLFSFSFILSFQIAHTLRPNVLFYTQCQPKFSLTEMKLIRYSLVLQCCSLGWMNGWIWYVCVCVHVDAHNSNR